MKCYTSDAHQTLGKIAHLNQRKLPPGLLVSNELKCRDEESTQPKITLLCSRSKKFTRSTSGLSTFFNLFSLNLIRITLLLWVLCFENVYFNHGMILLTSMLSSVDKASAIRPKTLNPGASEIPTFMWIHLSLA